MPAPLIAERWAGLQGPDPTPVLPDGCRDLILRMPPSGRPIVHINALDTCAREVRAAPGTRWLGLRLFAGVTARDGRAFDAQALLESPANRPLIKHIRQHPDDAEALLRELIDANFAPPPTLFCDYLDALATTDPSPHSHGVLSLLKVSERTLRRRITHATGAPPSFWRQLIRARQCARQIALTELPLVDIALAGGFSDQAHMHRELRRWFNAPPTQLRSQGPTYALRLRQPERGL